MRVGPELEAAYPEAGRFRKSCELLKAKAFRLSWDHALIPVFPLLSKPQKYFIINIRKNTRKALQLHSLTRLRKSLMCLFIVKFTAGDLLLMKDQNDQLLGALPATINIHLTRCCNFKCRYCYAVFPESNAAQISLAALQEILEEIASEAVPSSGRTIKVNFAGGEPLLHPGLVDAVKHGKSLGLRTSIVTNGSRLQPDLFRQFAGSLDILALSIDSMAAATNRDIGRLGSKCLPDLAFYTNLAGLIRLDGIRLKINTVVNRLNLPETIGHHIRTLQPFRWKILQAKKVIGQNDAEFGAVAVTESEFQEYVLRNSRNVGPGIVVVPETSDDMTASYAMIAPNGCFFDNSNGKYEYSQPIREVGIRAAFQQVQFNLSRFAQRGGIYA